MASFRSYLYKIKSRLTNTHNGRMDNNNNIATHTHEELHNKLAQCNRIHLINWKSLLSHFTRLKTMKWWPISEPQTKDNFEERKKKQNHTKITNSHEKHLIICINKWVRQWREKKNERRIVLCWLVVCITVFCQNIVYFIKHVFYKIPIEMETPSVNYYSIRRLFPSFHNTVFLFCTKHRRKTEKKICMQFQILLISIFPLRHFFLLRVRLLCFYFFFIFLFCFCQSFLLSGISL